MNYAVFLQQIEREISPFYIFEGKEEYLKKEALKKLNKKLITSPGTESFNFILLDALQNTSREIMEAAYQLPFNNKWMLVVVERADRLRSRDEEILLDYLKDPVSSTCIVFIGQKFNSQSKFYHFFRERRKIVSFNPLREKEAIRWILEKVKEQGKSISYEAAFLLAEKSRGDIFFLQNEINKLALFVHPETKIEQFHVLGLSGKGESEDIFNLLRAFRNKDLSLTLGILNKLFLQGEKPLLIESMLARELRILIRLKVAAQNITPRKACKFVFRKNSGFSDFHLSKAKEYMEAASSFSLSHLLFAQERILQAEFQIKKGRQQEEAALQQALIDILTLSE